MTDFETFDLGRVALQSGATLPDMLLSYKTYGRLNAARDNAIVYPTFYSGSHVDNEWLIGEHMGLDPREYFIIVHPSAAEQFYSMVTCALLVISGLLIKMALSRQNPPVCGQAQGFSAIQAPLQQFICCAQ